MRVAKIFYSVQGEAVDLGVPSIFIRCTGCNINPPCIWCDTAYALTGGVNMTTEEVVEEILKFPCRNIVFSGGEPTIQQEELIEVIETLLLKSGFFHFTIETNGKLTPSERLLELVDTWIVSPKLSNAGVKPYKIGEWFFDDKRGRCYLKFVVNDTKDLLEIQEYILSNENFGGLEEEEIFLMPQALTVKEHNKKLPFIIDFAKKYGYRVTPRLHILAWGNKRGV